MAASNVKAFCHAYQTKMKAKGPAAALNTTTAADAASDAANASCHGYVVGGSRQKAVSGASSETCLLSLSICEAFVRVVGKKWVYIYTCIKLSAVTNIDY